MSNKKVVIIDYGLCNLFSIRCACEYLGADVVISGDKNLILNAERVILPGVGAFAVGMDNLKKRGLVSVVNEVVNSGRPFLGICLGMQMLMTTSEEGGCWDGLNLIKGRVLRFSFSHDYKNLKIPHINWNTLKPSLVEQNRKNDFWHGTLLEGLKENSDMYFVHSYYVHPENKEDCLATTQYGNIEFCSVIRKNNIMGCQFHPERSGEMGLGILKNFIFKL